MATSSASSRVYERSGGSFSTEIMLLYFVSPTGTTDSLEPPAGSSYLNFTNANLGPGASVSAQLQFTDATRTTPINYTTRVLAGPGMR